MRTLEFVIGLTLLIISSYIQDPPTSISILGIGIYFWTHAFFGREYK